MHFDEQASREDQKASDKLALLRKVTEIFAKNCREAYNASSIGTIDEQLLVYRERCPFKVYIPNKPGKYNIKIWSLCDVETFYLCNFDVYLGKIANTAEK